MPHIRRADIEAIWRNCALGTVHRTTPAASGSRNETYFVNDAYVLRVNILDPQFAKFRNEQRAYDLLIGGALPVPHIVALDESRQVIPYDYLVMTRLPGVNLAESWRSLDPARVSSHAHEAGRWLARLHGTTLTGFGPLRCLADRPFRTWRDYFHDYVGRYMMQARERDLLDDRLSAHLVAALQNARDLLDGVTVGVLVHSDYHYENILQDAGMLSGLLDFEWALSGDPSFDFVTGPVREVMIPGSEAHFVAGYTSIRALDTAHPRRVALYRLFLHLETAVTDAMQGRMEGAHVALAQATAMLAQMERDAAR